MAALPTAGENADAVWDEVVNTGHGIADSAAVLFSTMYSTGALESSLTTIHGIVEAAATDALAAHTKVDALHDFDPTTDDVAHVILVDRTIANDDHLDWLYTP
jgi:hypothetical protein